MLAQSVIDIPLPSLAPWVMGLIGFMTLGITVLTFVLLVKKVFGPHPPVDKKLAGLRREIYEVSGRHKKELTVTLDALGERVDKTETSIEDIKLDRERKWHELQAEMRTLGESLSFIRGKFERKDHQS